MIGLICPQREKNVAREFFELFKTPWEFYRAGCNYPIVISTDHNLKEQAGGLLINYSTTSNELDYKNNLIISEIHDHSIVDSNKFSIPIYGKLVHIHGVGRPLIIDKSGGPLALELSSSPQRKILRIGYDLFGEVSHLLTYGQPVENAHHPTIELHIDLLRTLIIEAGVPLIEIPPVPWGYKFIACLTHDVDFAGIRYHIFDHTFFGFLYRALIGSSIAFLRRKMSSQHVWLNWKAVLSLPFVYLGLAEDFWDEFERFTQLEDGCLSTFYLIPFKNRPGEFLTSDHTNHRAARYDIVDVQTQVRRIASRGYEIGLHGIDAWHSKERGKQELNQIIDVTGQNKVGVRIHWLYKNLDSPSILDQTGFDYDSTSGYNETIGYLAGTTQVFMPPRATRLLELPLHIQDTALFYPRRLSLNKIQALDLFKTFLNISGRYGGVLTVLWHMRSLSPERLWGEFYIQLLQELKAQRAWFGTASQVVGWFRQRRLVKFEDSNFNNGKLRLKLKFEGILSEPRMILRIHKPHEVQPMKQCTKYSYIDFPYNGESYLEIPLSSQRRS